LTIEGGPVLDLCFQRVPEPPFEPPRLHLDLLGGARQTQEVERLLGLGARHLDIGQREVPWVVVADPEGLADRLDRRGRRRPPVPAPPVAASVAERGGRELHPGWGELPWRLYADPSGNEFCVLPARS
ncbi:MAG: VOC family protein, partial [Actinomycetes bacterium]